MIKLNPFPAWFHSVFIKFWALTLIYGFLCVLGPLIASGLNETQKFYQSILINALVTGIIFVPIIYVLMLFLPGAHGYPRVSYLAPACLVISILSTVMLFRSNDLKEFVLKTGETKTSQGLTIKFLSVGHETATSAPDAAPETYAVYVFEVKAGDKSGTLSLPVQSLPEKWEKYSITLYGETSDHSQIGVRIATF